MMAHPVHQLPPIAPIDPEQPHLFTGTAEPGEEETGASRVRDGGCRDEYGHQESQRINQQMAFTPFDVFACVVATFAAECRGLDALAVDAARRGVPGRARYRGDAASPRCRAIDCNTSTHWTTLDTHGGACAM